MVVDVIVVVTVVVLTGLVWMPEDIDTVFVVVWETVTMAVDCTVKVEVELYVEVEVWVRVEGVASSLHAEVTTAGGKVASADGVVKVDETA